jgi:DNA-binding beta-propeller fold protein YncE
MLTILFATVLHATPIALPDGPPVVMDYLAWDDANQRLWVPAGNTGKVDVLSADGKLTAIGGFPTAARQGRPASGPSSATLADGTVWIGNRADSMLCPIDGKTLAKGACVQLTSMPDGLAYVAATKELWVTTPRDGTLTIVPASSRGTTATLKVGGEPEGYAVDGERFYTNLEDQDKTLAIDVRTRKIVATFAPGCGKEGPRGLALDTKRKVLFVACTDGAAALDLRHDGKVVGRVKTGAGVDNIDSDGKYLYVASGRDGVLTLARIGDGGSLTVVSTAPTAKGARVVVVGGGAAWVADSQGGQILVVKP